VDELNAFLELIIGLDERGLGDAQGRLLLQRFDQDREAERFGSTDSFAAPDHGKLGHVNPVIAEDFFGDAFVFAEGEAGGAASGERHALHFEERHDVLIEGAVVLKLVGQVENHVRLEALEFLAQEIQVIKNGQVLHGVTQLLEGGQDMGFRFPVIRLQLGGQILIDRGGGDRIEQGQHF
jgi:hypothetical protein